MIKIFTQNAFGIGGKPTNLRTRCSNCGYPQSFAQVQGEMRSPVDIVSVYLAPAQTEMISVFKCLEL